MTVSPSHGMKTRVLRGAPANIAPVVIEELDSLPYTMDGRPISEELRAAKDAGFRKGWDDGWNRGYAAGQELGYEEAKEAAFAEFTSLLTPALAAVRSAVQRIEYHDHLTLTDIERAVMQLAVGVVEELVGHELALAEQPVLDAVQRALQLVPDRGGVLCRVHPDDHRIVSAVDNPLPGRLFDVVADAAVERGGAIVDVGACRIDAQIGPALERVRSVLLSTRPPRSRSDAAEPLDTAAARGAGAPS